MHRTCTAPAQYLRRTCVAPASHLHRTCIALASDLHRTCAVFARLPPELTCTDHVWHANIEGFASFGTLFFMVATCGFQVTPR